MPKSRLFRLNITLLTGVVLLVALPLLFLRNAEFSGADTQAGEVISTIQPDYEPWAEPLFSPNSSEVESLLFASQAGIGAGIIGYVMGWYRGRKEANPDGAQSSAKQSKS